MAGANPAAVQRILRHSDPRITTEVYGHLLPGYLRDEINRLSFGISPSPPPPPSPAVRRRAQPLRGSLLHICYSPPQEPIRVLNQLLATRTISQA